MKIELPVEDAAEGVPAASGGEDCIDQLPLPYIELDGHGVITRANRAALALHPEDRGALIGQTAWNLVAADEKDPSFASYCSALELGEDPGKVRRALCDRSGQFRTYEIYRSLIRDEIGAATGMRMLCVDVSEAKREMEEARGGREWLKSVVEAMCAAVIVTDAVGFIRAVNPAAEALLGGEAAELVGRSIEEGLPVRAFLPGGCGACTFTRWLEGPLQGIATILNCRGREVHVELSASPIVDKENDSTAGVVLELRAMEMRR